MGLFSRRERNQKTYSQLDKSLVRAFSAGLYFDSTMGRLFGPGDEADRTKAALRALAQAMSDNGTVSGDESIGAITDSKIQALHSAGMLVKDCHVFPLACIMWAKEDADAYGASRAVKQDLENAFALFLSVAAVFGSAEELAMSVTQNQAKYKQFASVMDRA